MCHRFGDPEMHNLGSPHDSIRTVTQNKLAGLQIPASMCDAQVEGGETMTVFLD